MKRWQSLVLPLCALVLVACGGSSDEAAVSPPASKVPELASAANASGNWLISVEQGSSVTVGRYWAGENGQRVMLLTDGDGKMTSVLVRKDASAAWVLGAGQEPEGRVQFASTVDETSTAGALLALSDMQARYGYAVRGAQGRVLHFTVDAQGRIQSSADDTCRWEGEVGISALPQTLTLRVEDNAGCWGGSTAWTGLLVRDAQDAPAAFRAISTDGSSPSVDAWVFAR